MKINSKEKEKRNLENYNTTRMFHGGWLRIFVTNTGFKFLPAIHLHTETLTSFTKKTPKKTKIYV
jgi:hypothetical protein